MISLCLKTCFIINLQLFHWGLVIIYLLTKISFLNTYIISSKRKHPFEIIIWKVRPARRVQGWCNFTIIEIHYYLLYLINWIIPENFLSRKHIGNSQAWDGFIHHWVIICDCRWALLSVIHAVKRSRQKLQR